MRTWLFSFSPLFPSSLHLAFTATKYIQQIDNSGLEARDVGCLKSRQYLFSFSSSCLQPLIGIPSCSTMGQPSCCEHNTDFQCIWRDSKVNFYSYSATWQICLEGLLHSTRHPLFLDRQYTAQDALVEKKGDNSNNLQRLCPTVGCGPLKRRFLVLCACLKQPVYLIQFIAGVDK